MATDAYVGHIKSFVPSKGYGFIECQDTFEVYGKDIFVMKTSLPGGYLDKGVEVSFSVTQGRNGPEASDVQLTGEVFAVADHGWAPKGKDASKFFSGVVKSYNPKKGWGLIQCEQTFQMYGKDMFMLRTSLPNEYIDPGTSVRFQIIAGTKGPEAGNIQVRPPGFQGYQGAWMAYPSPQSRMQPFNARAVAVPFLSADSKTHHGVVKSFNADKGWGFITAKDNIQAVGKEDLFVMRSEIEGESLQPGEKVQFRMRKGKRGLEACEVKPLPDTAELANTMFTGSIKSFNEQKGWGFIESEQSFEIFSKDIFVHGNALQGQVPSVGTTVQFGVNIRDDGRPEAAYVTLGQSNMGPVRQTKGKHRGKPY